jgi:2-haloacid dehalogenase
MPRALLFDVFGTLVDWRGSLIDAASSLNGHGPGADWPTLIDDWRRAYQPAMDQVAAAHDDGRAPWRNLDSIQSDTLNQALAAHAIHLGADEHSELIRAWRRLSPWPDTREGLDLLRAKAITATLSNGHVALVVDLLRFAGLRMDAVLSAELASSYKPNPVVYLRALDLLECEPAEALLVACHAKDLAAASALGLRTAFVRRPQEWGPAGGDEPPYGLPGLIVVDSLIELAQQL